ncbi:MAG: PIN domain-containing protein, partial [Patescibacteria group bacterium]
MAKATTEKLILLDVHAILHRAYHAMPDFTSKAGEPTGGIYGLATMLMRIIKELKPDFIAACYDLPEPTFRKAIYDDYKAGRPKTDESLVKQIIRSRDLFTAFNIPIFEAPGFEADDLLGTIVEKTKGEKSLEVVIASGDMDTLQLVAGKRVKVYTLKKGINDTI